MSFKATHRFARISARKVRPLADMIRGKFADEALDILKYQPERGARLLEKVLQSAMGNAQDPDQNPGKTIRVEQLVVIDARVDGGPMFKRIRPVSRGMAYGIQRRMADWHFAQATSWSELREARDRWLAEYNEQVHWAHRAREDGRRSPAEVPFLGKCQQKFEFIDQEACLKFQPISPVGRLSQIAR